MLNNKNNLELTAEAKERTNKLQVVIDNFEEVSLKYGPVSSDELKTRINKIIKNFDSELKKILELKFETFWNSQKIDTLLESKDEISDSNIPKFLKNYKK
jgi:hypothetical protein|tara:strand:+ start:43 stop:342 length:300 start_codon:yes stop_codon:yes gene_type:complete